jgi:hypothetical protein
MSFHYKMWKSIGDNYARTEPALAVLFLFVPIFCYYWYFVVYHGFAIDYNKYVNRYGLKVPLLETEEFKSFAKLLLASVVTLLIPFVGELISFFIDLILFFKAFSIILTVCDAINRLEDAKSKSPKKKWLVAN